MSSFGKKTANPGFLPGANWFECPRCSFVIYASDARKEWTGLYVCPECWDPRHPQDFVRGVPDNQRPTGPVRSESTDTFVSVTYTLNTGYTGHGSYAISGIARAGQARCGKGASDPDQAVPAGTFGGVSGV